MWKFLSKKFMIMDIVQNIYDGKIVKRIQLLLFACFWQHRKGRKQVDLSLDIQIGPVVRHAIGNKSEDQINGESSESFH